MDIQFDYKGNIYYSLGSTNKVYMQTSKRGKDEVITDSHTKSKKNKLFF